MAFQNVGASIKACAAIAELIPNASALQQLHLFNNMSDNAGAVRSPMYMFSICIHARICELPISKAAEPPTRQHSCSLHLLQQ